MKNQLIDRFKTLKWPDIVRNRCAAAAPPSTSKRNEDYLYICLSTIYISKLAGYSPKSVVPPPRRFAYETHIDIYISIYQLYTSTKWLDIVRNKCAAAAIVFNYIYIRPFLRFKTGWI